jgi:SH3-like domain-containing protein
MRKTLTIIMIVAASAWIGAAAWHAHAKDETKPVSARIGPSGLRLPRFVSLKASRVNVRKGPSLDYPVAWQFKRIGLPVEVINEFENWRQVRDSDNSEGWVFHSLLSGRRTALVTPWAKEGGTVLLYARRSTSSTVVARLEPGVLGSLLQCNGKWCNFSLDSVSGWIEQVKLWGVYENEKIE